MPASAPTLPKDISDAFAAGATADDVLRAATAAKPFTIDDLLAPPSEKSRMEFETAGALIGENPEQRHYVIHGLLREREILNFISASKAGKTWAMLDLALCIATGRAWMNQFAVARGEVLYIDAELHRQTIAARLKSIASARGILTAEYATGLQFLSLRGRLRTITELEQTIRAIAPGRFRVILIDSLYRVWPAGMDENSNADVTAVYNILDRWADLTGAAIICVHHASKGSQSGKAIADVGSGAGAQSRAADTHLVLRAHEQDDAAVLDCVCRSSAPMNPLGLRWAHPTWSVDPGLDVDRLREPGRKVSGQTWTPQSFTDQVLNGDGKPAPRNVVLAKATAAGIPRRTAEELLGLAQSDGLIDCRQDTKDGRKIVYFRPGEK